MEGLFAAVRELNVVVTAPAGVVAAVCVDAHFSCLLAGKAEDWGKEEGDILSWYFNLDMITKARHSYSRAVQEHFGAFTIFRRVVFCRCQFGNCQVVIWDIHVFRLTSNKKGNYHILYFS